MRGRTRFALALILSVALTSCGGSGPEPSPEASPDLPFDPSDLSDLIIKHTDHYLYAEFAALEATYLQSQSWVIEGNGQVTLTALYLKNKRWVANGNEVTHTNEYGDRTEVRTSRILPDQLQAIAQAISPADFFHIPNGASGEFGCVTSRDTVHTTCVTQHGRTHCVEYPTPGDCPTLRTRKGEALLEIESTIHKALSQQP